MCEERTKATTHTFGFGSKAALLFEIIRVSMEVQEYGSIVRNDGNDKSFCLHVQFIVHIAECMILLQIT